MTKEPGFAIWLTGLPASGKSTVCRALVERLDAEKVPIVVLESDRVRKVLLPDLGYNDAERDRFYRVLPLLGELIVQRGVNVIFDATANRRSYRDDARGRFSRFLEVFVDCPLAVTKQRDPKGIYARAASGAAAAVPGVQAPYEPPLHPEVALDGTAPPGEGAERIIAELRRLHWL